MQNIFKNIAIPIICFIFIASLQSCILFLGYRGRPFDPLVDTHEKNGFVKATVVNYTLDGCTFMLQLADEKKLEPVNLTDEFKKDNFKVWVKYQHYSGNSVCMAGEMVTITAIEKNTGIASSSKENDRKVQGK